MRQSDIRIKLIKHNFVSTKTFLEVWVKVAFLFLYLLQVAELVATEFFEQGDKERQELNIEPIVSKQI